MGVHNIDWIKNTSFIKQKKSRKVFLWDRLKGRNVRMHSNFITKLNYSYLIGNSAVNGLQLSQRHHNLCACCWQALECGLNTMVAEERQRTKLPPGNQRQFTFVRSTKLLRPVHLSCEFICEPHGRWLSLHLNDSWSDSRIWAWGRHICSASFMSH